MLLTICRPTSGRIRRLGRPWSDRRTLSLGFMGLLSTAASRQFAALDD